MMPLMPTKAISPPRASHPLPFAYPKTHQIAAADFAQRCENKKEARLPDRNFSEINYRLDCRPTVVLLPGGAPQDFVARELRLMRCIPFRTLALLLVSSLLAPGFALAQQDRRAETRARRTQNQPAANRAPIEAKDPDTSQPKQWNAGDTTVTQMDARHAVIGGTEPVMRIALATDLRAATVSTTAGLMSATDFAQTFVPLDVARVRVESRLLSPLPMVEENFGLRIAGLSSRAQADAQAQLIREATSEQSKAVLDVETQTWGLLVGPRRSREDAEIAQARLEDAGFAATVIDLAMPINGSIAQTSARQSGPERSSPNSLPPPLTRSTAGVTPEMKKINAAVNANANSKSSASSGSGNSAIRLTSRPSVPTRELIASTVNSGKLFSSNAPVLFASDDETKAPVRFNDKPYRGRIEVFANTRGLLTVVNVIGLEDYVRGVVANELSPGGYPQLEALKAQAIAARTYAIKNRGQYMSQGFDLLPTTRSQVYRGLTSEQPLSTRAVDETRGLVATYDGQPINALYTSTCGGRTEDAANIFAEAVPYLRARECAVEGRGGLEPFTIKSAREPADIREEQHVPLARAAALLSIHKLGSIAVRVSDSWLSSPASHLEVRSWLGSVAALAHQSLPTFGDDVNLPGAFATALSLAAFGESRADTLLNNADVEYFLAIRDANEVPAPNRADVALLLRDGYLSVFPDASLHPREKMTRGRVLHAIARLLENRGLLQMQKGTARPASDGTLILRSAKGKDQPLRVSGDAYLFRQIGEAAYPVRSVILVGGEPVNFHINTSGAVDYLEVRPAPGGAAADRFSPFSNWTSELSPGAVKARLGRFAQGIGTLIDLRVVTRGASRRVTDLEVTGSEGIAHVRGGRIRSALGLREQLFVVEKKYDADGRLSSFLFTGRGWGHGVGMCQVGAYGLARQGWSYEKILKAYYTGIELTRMY
ncbi:MAG: SpoIID/LytB domain protein [Acidobacteria bacterium]|nr:SpoIID/LytB domain protein [Acidobacteriota bacterium]